MLSAIDDLLQARDGVAHRGELLRVVTRGQLNHEARSGRLVAPFARALCRPWDADQPQVRHRAAALSVGAPCALSHLTALRRAQWLEERGDEAVHVTVPQARSLRSQPGLVRHRATVLPRIANLGGLITVSRADAIVSSWPLLPVADRRAPAIDAVRKRLVAPQSLTEALPRHLRIPDLAELRQLIRLLAEGCESDLEIRGFLGVFDHPGLRHGVRQRWVRVGDENFRVDLGYDDERVAVELDGDRWHSTREQRERDRRRDAKLASTGWLTLRFSYGRLHNDVHGCRADTLATLAARRAPVLR